MSEHKILWLLAGLCALGALFSAVEGDFGFYFLASAVLALIIGADGVSKRRQAVPPLIVMPSAPALWVAGAVVVVAAIGAVGVGLGPLFALACAALATAICVRSMERRERDDDVSGPV